LAIDIRSLIFLPSPDVGKGGTPHRGARIKVVPCSTGRDLFKDRRRCVQHFIIPEPQHTKPLIFRDRAFAGYPAARTSGIVPVFPGFIEGTPAEMKIGSIAGRATRIDLGKRFKTETERETS
jgi:hypothetical protein